MYKLRESVNPRVSGGGRISATPDFFTGIAPPRLTVSFPVRTDVSADAIKTGSRFEFRSLGEEDFSFFFLIFCTETRVQDSFFPYED